jgi:hypothetical protein
VRRLRPCFASTGPGGCGSPSVPTTGRCPKGLDGAGRTGRKPRDRAGEESAVRVPEARSRGPKSPRWSAGWRALRDRSAAPQGARLMVALLGAPSPRALPPGEVSPAPAGRMKARPAPLNSPGAASACPRFRTEPPKSVGNLTLTLAGAQRTVSARISGSYRCAGSSDATLHAALVSGARRLR